MNFSTERKLADFDWLYKKLTEFYIGLKGSSDKKVLNFI